MKYNHLKFIAYGEMTVKTQKRLVMIYISRPKSRWCFTSAGQKISEF